jgi:uncharacterized protein (TIGR02996 family)
MSDEFAFLKAILDNPEDDAPRLVYADWLEEQGDPAADAKAVYLRDTAAVLTASDREAKQLDYRMRQAARVLPSKWLAVVSHVVLEKCAAEFAVVCPKRWEKLTATDDVNVRHCSECRQSVHYCTSIPDARAHAHMGECVAVALGVARRPHDLDLESMVLGRMLPPTRRN